MMLVSWFVVEAKNKKIQMRPKTFGKFKLLIKAKNLKIKKIIRTSKDTMIVILFLFLKSLCNNFLSGPTISKYF